jgi:hypothetical protein
MTLSRHLSYANVASTLAVVLALGGGGAAVAAGLGKNTVGSKQIKPAAVKAVDLAPGAVTSDKVVDDSLTGADVAESTLGKVPTAGSADRAAQADSADSATVAGRATNVLAALVDDDGTLVTAQSEGAVSAARLAPGSYEVAFGRDVRDCTYVASAADPGVGVASVALVSATSRSAEPNAVFVLTRDPANTVVDKSFALAVIC